MLFKLVMKAFASIKREKTLIFLNTHSDLQTSNLIVCCFTCIIRIIMIMN